VQRSLGRAAGLVALVALAAGTTGEARLTSATFGSVIRNTVDQVDDLSGSQVHVLYVLPSDGLDEALDVNGQIATSVSAFQTWLRGQTGGRQLRVDTRAEPSTSRSSGWRERTPTWCRTAPSSATRSRRS
jgi:hypothetical protein